MAPMVAPTAESTAAEEYQPKWPYHIAGFVATAFEPGDAKSAQQQPDVFVRVRLPRLERVTLDHAAMQLTADATARLLQELFGAAAKVVIRTDVDWETGAPEFVLDLLTPDRPGFEARDQFLDRFLLEVPNSVGPSSPVLMWNPQRAG